jgi:hypothetical protein
MYNQDILFGGISILLIGDFIQLPVTTGHNLWSVMYGTVNGNNATVQNLFQQFHVHELTANMRAADCVIHMQQVAAFCALPLVYPTRQKWSAKDNAHYKPITKDTVDGVTHELTSQDIEQDINWITHLTCIITSNVDRAINNAAAAKAFGKRKANYMRISHSHPKPSFTMKMRDLSSLLILFREVLAKFLTMLMATFTLVLQIALHVQCIHWHGMIQRRNAWLFKQLQNLHKAR